MMHGSAAVVIDERPVTPCLSDVDSPAASAAVLLRNRGEVCSLSDCHVTSGYRSVTETAAAVVLQGNWDPAVQTFTDATSVVHENYNRDTIDSDIAIIQLSTALSFNDYVQPICLPSSRVPAGTNCVVTGWGDTNSTQT